MHHRCKGRFPPCIFCLFICRNNVADFFCHVQEELKRNSAVCLEPIFKKFGVVREQFVDRFKNRS